MAKNPPKIRPGQIDVPFVTHRSTGELAELGTAYQTNFRLPIIPRVPKIPERNPQEERQPQEQPQEQLNPQEQLDRVLSPDEQLTPIPNALPKPWLPTGNEVPILFPGLFPGLPRLPGMGGFPAPIPGGALAGGGLSILSALSLYGAVFNKIENIPGKFAYIGEYTYANFEMKKESGQIPSFLSVKAAITINDFFLENVTINETDLLVTTLNTLKYPNISVFLSDPKINPLNLTIDQKIMIYQEYKSGVRKIVLPYLPSGYRSLGEGTIY